MEGKLRPDKKSFYHFQHTTIKYFHKDMTSFLPADATGGDLFMVIAGGKFTEELCFKKKYMMPVVFIACQFTDVAVEESFSVSFIGCSGNNFHCEKPGTEADIILHQCSLQKMIFKECNQGCVLIDHSGIRNLNVEECVFSDFAVRHSKLEKIDFRDNKMLDSVDLFAVKVSQFEVYGCEDIDSMQITDKSAIEDLHIESSACTYFKVEGKSTIGSLFLEDTKISGFYLDKSITEFLEVSLGSSLDEISMTGASAVGICKVGESKIGIFTLADTSVCCELNIMESRCGQLLTWPSARLVSVEVNESELGLFFLDGQQSNVLIGGTSINRGRFKNCRLNECRLELTRKADLFIDNTSINFLDLENASFPKDGLLNVVDCSIFYIRFRYAIILGQLVLQNLKPSPLVAAEMIRVNNMIHTEGAEESVGGDDFQQVLNKTLQEINSKVIKFHDELRERFHKEQCLLPQMELVNSSLNKTEMTDCKFSEFNVLYRNSKILEIFTLGTQFNFEKIKIVNVTDSRDEMEQKASIHHQLRKVYENQGDFVQGSYHHSQAMRYQYRLLHFQYRNAAWLKKLSTWFERRGYSLNWVSNAYGESWPRALFFILCVTFFWYTFYYMSLHFSAPVSFSMVAIGDYCKNLIPFFDITHKIKVDETPSWAVLWDCLGRIFISYGIFQFIAAFRRHGKKAI